MQKKKNKKVNSSANVEEPSNEHVHSPILNSLQKAAKCTTNM